MSTQAPDLSMVVAVVAGASRGVGRGVALALGEAGATVYVTGRTLKGRRRDVPGSIDETASDVTAAGGRGIAVQTDHTRVEDVRSLMDGVRIHEGRLDVLVNAVWGGNEAVGSEEPFWDQPLAHWDATVRSGAWAAFLTSRFAVPLLMRSSHGLIVTVSRPHDAGPLAAGVAHSALDRLAVEMAEDLRPHGVASVALQPGRVRTERALAAAGGAERRWQRASGLIGTESPRYAGRAVAALAADPAVLALSGQTLVTADLAHRYGFTDVDGTQPGAPDSR